MDESIAGLFIGLFAGLLVGLFAGLFLAFAVDSLGLNKDEDEDEAPKSFARKSICFLDTFKSIDPTQQSTSTSGRGVPSISTTRSIAPFHSITSSGFPSFSSSSPQESARAFQSFSADVHSTLSATEKSRDRSAEGSEADRRHEAKSRRRSSMRARWPRRSTRRPKSFSRHRVGSAETSGNRVPVGGSGWVREEEVGAFRVQNKERPRRVRSWWMDSVGASGDRNAISSREKSRKPAVEVPPKLQIKK